jgi:superfamily II DNA or RNA helicase
MIYRGLDERLPQKFLVNIITGDTRQASRDHIIRSFQDVNDLTRKILVCTSGTMSESVSLTNAGLLVFAQEPTSLQQFIQCRGRVRRVGSTHVVPAISLRAEDTVEEHLALHMSNKIKVYEEYFEALSNERK